MYATFTSTRKGTRAYIQKSVRIDKRTTTLTVKCLGLLSDIQKEQGCEDPRRWVRDYAALLTAEEREGKKCISANFSPSKLIEQDMSQTALAAKLGKTFNMVNMYAKNKVQPPVPVLYQMAEILNVDVRTLLVPNKVKE